MPNTEILSRFAVPAGAAVSLIALTRYLMSRGTSGKSKLPYPPGPKVLPLIGNALAIPQDVPVWEGFSQMAEKYQTDVLFLDLFGTHHVVLNSSEAIADLLDKRSAIYSDKPQTPLTKLTGLNEWSFTVFEYGEKWRTYRRLFHEFFHVAAVKRYDEDLKKAASRFLQNLSEHPADFNRHILLATGSIALSITYDIQVDSAENLYFRVSEEATEIFEPAMVPGAFPVEVFPILRYVPSWLPGGGSRSYGERVYKASMDSINLPMQYAMEQHKAGGKSSSSLVTDCLENLENLRKQGVDETVIRDVAGTVYNAMTDTTKTVLKTFFLAMARNTHVVKKAQQQLDDVLSGGRLPEHSDMDDLPYITAIIKEIFRWSPPVPVGTTHRLMEDDVYKGMFIPAGTMLMENIWGICHDEEVYPDPDTFNPDRFIGEDGKIDPSVKDPELRIFGSGRRICPGKHFALRNLHLVIANVLTTFDILPPVDENGHPQPPPPAFRHSIIRYPLPFNCIIRPRSEKALGLVKDLYSHYWL